MTDASKPLSKQPRAIPIGRDGAIAPCAVSVAIDPVALVISECITVNSAMRKNARWAQSSVAAILGGGGGSGYDSNGTNTPVPGSLGSATRKGKLTVGEIDGDVGLAGRWGLRGKKGKSIQDNPLVAAFAKLRGELQECKGQLSIYSARPPPTPPPHLRREN